MQHDENPSEELFARLCTSKYFGGFVYQNPKFTQGSEAEAGDVVVWVRDWLVIFEVIWRNPATGPKTKRFVKRFGEKRDQLLTDFDIYANPEIAISMRNEDGEATEYDHDQFNERTTRGVVLVDAPGIVGRLHYDTVRLTAEAPHPIAVMTRSDFETLLSEADTVADLGLYLGDRHRFLKETFYEDPGPFLQLGDQLEQELVGHYKLFDNTFNMASWRESADKRFWHRYQVERSADIARRDRENKASEILDGLISAIRTHNRPDSLTIQPAWELAMLTRRERAALNAAIQNKYDRLMATGRDQKFAVTNFHTGCWDVFYLYQGIDREFFRAEAQRLADRKMWVERALNDFQLSVFCFAIRYSSLGLGDIDEVVMTVSDAHKWPTITREQLEEAQRYFAGMTSKKPIVEFP